MTGSGKTFTMAKVIEALDRPALVLAHNKTLAAQLFHEFKIVLSRRTRSSISSATTITTSRKRICRRRILYIDKESTINDELDKLRMSATRSLFERRDVIIVASRLLHLRLGLARSLLRHAGDGRAAGRVRRARALLRSFVDIQYERSEDLRRGTFRVRGDMIEIYPPYEDFAYRIEMWGDQIDSIRQIDPLTGELRDRDRKTYRASADLSEVALRDAGGATRARDSGNSSGAGLVEAGTREAGQVLWRRSG